jgi:hypothetical protein
MEGSAISRSATKKSISNAADPDMDGNQMVHPTSQGALKGNNQPQPSLGRDGFTDKDPQKSGAKIKGGQNA